MPNISVFLVTQVNNVNTVPIHNTRINQPVDSFTINRLQYISSGIIALDIKAIINDFTQQSFNNIGRIVLIASTHEATLLTMEKTFLVTNPNSLSPNLSIKVTVHYNDIIIDHPIPALLKLKLYPKTGFSLNGFDCLESYSFILF